MLKLTLEFNTLAELEVAVQRLKGEYTADAEAVPGAKVAAPKPLAKSAPATTPTAETTKPATQATAPAETAAASPSEVAYADLKTAVLVLVGKDQAAAVALAAELGVKNFKVYESPERAGDRAAALAAVNAKIGELG